MNHDTSIADIPPLSPYRHVLADCGVRTLGDLIERVESGDRLAWRLSELRGVPGIGEDDERFIKEYIRSRGSD